MSASSETANPPVRTASVGTPALPAASPFRVPAARPGHTAGGEGGPSEVAQRGIATLSPGERTRVALTVVAHQRATCLLLDEPTNHLDIESLEIVEAALRDWPGGLVVVTHDRRLQRELRLDRRFAL
jgi:ABC-type transport system involved in cytochrome bd biosynthesis fused ATPase/permease subunit